MEGILSLEAAASLGNLLSKRKGQRGFTRPFVPHSQLTSTVSVYKMAIFGPLGLSFAPQIQKSRTLYRWLKPVSDWYAQVAGYRQMGLKYDDLRECGTILLLTGR